MMMVGVSMVVRDRVLVPVMVLALGRLGAVRMVAVRVLGMLRARVLALGVLMPSVIMVGHRAIVVVVPELFVMCEVQPRPQLYPQHPHHHRQQGDGGVPKCGDRSAASGERARHRWDEPV